MQSVLHDPRAGLTEIERKAFKERVERRRRMNGAEVEQRAERAAHTSACVDKMVLAMKAAAAPPPPPTETWEERQSRINPLPSAKPEWFHMAEDEIEPVAPEPPEPRKPRIEDIQRAVATRYDVSRAELMCARRTAKLVRPRQIAMYLAKTLTPKSYPEIGRRFGGRDHTTILHAFRKIEALVETDATVKEEIDRLTIVIEGAV